MENSTERARRIAHLLAVYVKKTITENEKEELDEWIGANTKNVKLFEELTDPRRINAAIALLTDKPQIV